LSNLVERLDAVARSPNGVVEHLEDVDYHVAYSRVVVDDQDVVHSVRLSLQPPAGNVPWSGTGLVSSATAAPNSVTILLMRSPHWRLHGLALARWRLRGLALALWLTAGCAAPAPAAPTVTPVPPLPTSVSAPTPAPSQPTPAAATSVSSPPTAGPTTPTIEDTLSPELRRAFANARQHAVNGNFLMAAESWSQLRAAPALSDAGASEVRVQLALALARAGRGADALSVLDSAPALTDPRVGFARGLALAATNQHAEAMRALHDFAQSNPGVAAAVWLEIGERELRAQRHRESADAAANGLNAAQSRQLKQELLEVRAQALAALGDNEAAFDAHRQVLALATSNATLGEQLFRLAEVSRDLGKPAEAVRALRTALDQFASASTTADALRLLDELDAAGEVDPYILGRARYFAADFRNAVRAFDHYLQADPNGPDAPSARLYRALASLSPGNEPNALRELDRIAEDPDQETEIAAQALLEAGQALEGLAESDQAETRYQRLIDRFPRLDAAATAAFRLGLARFVRGADSEALAAWDALLTRRGDLASDDVARVLYWRGKSLQRLGRATESQASWTEAAAVRPAGYYALRAATILASLSGRGRREAPGEGGVNAEDEAALARWMTDRRLDLAASEGVVRSDAALARAEQLASLGLLRQGNWEVDELLQRYPDRADRLFVLARRFTGLGLVGGATRLGQAAYSAASIEAPQDAPAALRKMAFPRPFAGLTDAVAGDFGLDPLLLEATLRDASHFDPWSENSATGARGLALMRPIHAEEAAHGLQTDDVDASAPRIAIEHQAWLLADRLRRFDGRPEAALAALSTTERLADGWLVRPGAPDPDTFIELIDYEGVRAGLRGLLATRLAYGVTYGAPPDRTADPLSPVSAKPEPTAAWIKITRLDGGLPATPPVSPAAQVGSSEQRLAFARGATLQRDGDFAAAADVFRGLTVSSDPEVADAASLRLAESLLGLSRPSDALSLLPTADTAAPGSSATFLLGRAFADLGRCTDALPAFDRFAQSVSAILAAHAYTASAECRLRLGRAAEAVPLLEQSVATPGLPRLQTIEFREQLALARLRSGDVDGARAELSGLLSIARSDSYRAELNYDLGLLEPDVGAAAERFRTAVRLDPRGRAAQAALDELVSLQDPFATSFEAAETRFEQDRYREALAAYSAFLEANPSDRRAAQALYGRGISLVRLGQDRAGIAVLESIGRRFPNTLDAADGMFRGGRIRESLADLDGALRSYQQVVGQPGAGTRATDAEFRLAFVQFKLGDYASAANGWRTLAGRLSAAEDQAQAWFWLGKVLVAMGDSAGGRSAWSTARSTDPRGFYGLRADDLLAGRSEPAASWQTTLPILERAVSADLSNELRAWAASRGGDVSAAEARVFADTSFARAELLLAMGLRREAVLELGALEERLGGDVTALAVLGGWEHSRGLYNRSLLLAFNLASVSRSSLLTGPPALRKLAYPLPHPVVLAQAARDMRADPLLFAALMRQESNMDQDVESAAQARGLSQLIASTAYEAARALGVYSFRTADLFQPRTNITLGAFTFAQRLARYDDHIFPSLAAYNASQLAVDGWLLAAGEADIDTFAEAIPFTETYPYVQRIYENYRQYLELYGSQ